MWNGSFFLSLVDVWFLFFVSLLPRIEEEPKKEEEEELLTGGGGSWRLEPFDWKILLNSSSLVQEGGDISS